MLLGTGARCKWGFGPGDCEVYQFPVGVAYLSGGTRPAVHARGQWAESVDEVYR